MFDPPPAPSPWLIQLAVVLGSLVALTALASELSDEAPGVVIMLAMLAGGTAVVRGTRTGWRRLDADTLGALRQAASERTPPARSPAGFAGLIAAIVAVVAVAQVPGVGWVAAAILAPVAFLLAYSVERGRDRSELLLWPDRLVEVRGGHALPLTLDAIDGVRWDHEGQLQLTGAAGQRLRLDVRDRERFLRLWLEQALERLAEDTAARLRAGEILRVSHPGRVWIRAAGVGVVGLLIVSSALTLVGADTAQTPGWVVGWLALGLMLLGYGLETLWGHRHGGSILEREGIRCGPRLLRWDAITGWQSNPRSVRLSTADRRSLEVPLDAPNAPLLPPLARLLTGAARIDRR